MYPNPFKTGEAEPLRKRRIWPPPICRRFSGGNTVTMPSAIRWVVRRITGSITGGYPPAVRAQLPGNCREVAGKLPGSLLASRRPMSRKFPPPNRRSAAGSTAAFAGQAPSLYPSYARLMPGTDPNLLRQAAADFQPRRRARYQNLQPCREVILELRGKGASCESIAELLTRYGVKTSRTMVTEFVGLLAESKGGRRKPRSMWVTALATTPPAEPPIPTQAITAMPAPMETMPVKSRGPRIAKIELLKPDEKPD